MAANARGPTKKDLKYLLSGLHTDVEFLVGDCPCTRIKAHKLILATRNDVFETMFYGSMPEEGDVIIPDLHPDGFREFLSYLYSHEAKFADVETALLTKSAAQKYLDLNLVGLCTEFVRKSIKPETLCFVLDVLAVSDEPMSEYDGAINETLKTRAGEVLNSKTFISASVVTLLEILRRKKRVSEYKVLRGIHAWAAVKCSAVADTPSDKMKALLSELLSLTLGEFVEGPAHWKIFTEVEAYRILSNIIKRGSMPLPAFCKKRNVQGLPSSAMAANAPQRGPTRKDLKYLLDGLHTDVEFLVGDSPRTLIKAHKLVLAMRNDVFETMFYGSMPEKGDVLIPDLHPDGFRGFLSYLYSHEAEFANVETALLTKRAAQKYLELDLVGLCTDFVRNSIKPQNLCFVLDVFTASHESTEEYDDIINIILKMQAGKVLDSKSFLAASESTILEVLKREKVISEYEILWSIHAWAFGKCSAVAGLSSDKLLESSMKPFLSEIKLLSLTPMEFVEGPATWKIFTVDEAYRILSNIIKRGSMPLPEFCKA